MPSDRTDGTLRDILHQIDLATQFVLGLDRERFKANMRTVYLEERHRSGSCAQKVSSPDGAHDRRYRRIPRNYN
jgi:hypothetical protein